jgi:tetratricopeptide (TPR) repeat protein
VASLRGDHEQALALLEPLYRQMQERDGVGLAIRYTTVDRLASTYHQLGDLEAAAEGHAEANELARRVFGEENPNYAIHLANSANVERELGRYEESDSRNLQAIALYDRIYGATPIAFRSVARRNRARTLLAMGRFDEALRELAASTREHARVRGMAAEDDPSRFFHEAEMLIQMHRWPEAVSRLTRARELYGASPSVPLSRAEAMLVRALCRQGRLAAAERVLETLDDRAADELHDDSRSRAERHTARACVGLRAGRHEAALQAVDLALAAVTSPGRVVDRADRRILRARILAATDRLPEASNELDRAESLYRKLDLEGHPLFPEIDRVRSELLAGGGASRAMPQGR